MQQHLAMLQSQWETLLAQHAQLSGNLNLAMDQVIDRYVFYWKLVSFP